jgi:ribosome biogenesis protein YTM1
LHRIWKDGAVCTQVLEGHSGAVTSSSFINKGCFAQNICYGVSAKIAVFLPLPPCKAMSILKQTNLNNVVPGVETDGSLHVVTGSKDRSLRLFKVNLFSFLLLQLLFIYPAALFYLSYIMLCIPEV